jgi:hypothetical protein
VLETIRSRNVEERLYASYPPTLEVDRDHAEGGSMGEGSVRKGLRMPVWAAVGLCLLLLLPSRALAASSTDETSYPLRPADTTSPRTALESLEEYTQEAMRRFRARRPPAGRQAPLKPALGGDARSAIELRGGRGCGPEQSAGQ